MKKFIFSAIAAIGLLLSPSCSDENEALSGSGNEALVSFSVNLADGVSTKADPATVIGDGTTAKELYVRVFDDGGTLIDGLSNQTYDISGKSTTVNLNLVKGKTYKFLFWAQSGETNAFSFDGTTVKVSYANAKANDEKRDAFYYACTKTVTGSFQETVTLHRPFAQLNFLTTEADIIAAKNGGLSVEKTSITVASAAQTLSPSFDPANTKPSVSVEKENAYFDFEDVPFTVSGNNTVSSLSYLWIKDGKVKETEEEGATKYFYLATTYFLVNNAADAMAQIVLADVKMKVQNAEGNGLSVQSVPVCMNYRTNIYGNLLTSTGKFNVTIEEYFNRPQLPEQDIEIKEQEVDSEAAAAAAFAAGASKVTLTEELPESTNSNGIIPQTYARENTEVIELVLEKPITEGYIFTYKENTGSGTNTFAPATVHITIPEGSATINESNIRLPQSTVYVNGVKVTTMTAETYSHTLVVGPGTEIGTLNVKQGHVRIMNGGKVGTIVNQTANPRVDVIVDLEEGGTLENIPEASKQIIVRRSISTAEELKAFAEAVNGGNTYAGQTVVLSADIDLNNATWTPIGKYVDDNNYYFQGTFDGQNHTIKNLSINMPQAKCVGLFGKLMSPGKILNVKIENASVKGQQQVGALVGSAYTGEITDCEISGNIKIEGNWQVGGLAGYGYAQISDCSVTGNSGSYVKGVYKENNLEGDAVGGIIGYYAEGQKDLENCTASINVEGTRKVGGLAGQVGYDGITVSGTFTGTVSTNADNDYIAANVGKIMVGGIVGEMTGEEGKNNTITINATITSGSKVIGAIPTTTGLIIGGTRTAGATLNTDGSTFEGAIVKIPIAPGFALVNGDYEISSADGLQAFAKAVNEGRNSFSGQNVYLGADIDLQDEDWTPVGQTGATQFLGTFDGQNHTISNLTINNTDDGEHCSTGLFGWLNSATVKNINVNGATVTGHHNVGVIAGYLETSGCTIDNCHVSGADISCTSVNDNADGDKCGGIVGYAGNAGVTVNNCTVKDSSISAGRDAGQVVGCAKEVDVENCSAENVTVTANGTSTGANIREEVIGRVL